MSSEEAYFAFETRPETATFVFKLTDPQKIAEARAILSGKQTDRTHVMGKIVKSPAPYNPDWDFHIAPESIQFFEIAIEVCDASISYVNDHLDEACGAFLPGCHWCPWSSQLVKEISYP
jgi:hypothetical protein